MNTYIVTLKSSGAEVYRYNADAPIEFTGFEFATHDHSRLVADAASPNSSVREWDAFTFLRRFSANERISARIRAKSDVLLEDFFELLLNAPIIRSDDPDVISGLNYLTTLGIMTDVRVNEILRGD